jgi:8-oxo-dGTP diphosphatase
MSEVVVRKVVAYVTQGDRLLVFRHTRHPEAGIQVPAGTIEEREGPGQAVLREVWEETGLDGLEIRSVLGMRRISLLVGGRAEVHVRHFFHLVLRGEAPARWTHFEEHPSDGSPAPIEFEFYWVRFPGEVPELAGGQGELLHRVEQRDE